MRVKGFPKKHPLSSIVILGLILRAITALANPGFISFDDYQSVLRLLIPFQRIPSVAWIIESSELRSPLTRLVLYPIPYLAFHLGLSDPFWQIRLLYLGVGTFSCLMIVAAYKIFSQMGRASEARIAALAVATHFLLPYINTRVMFENLCMTPFFLSLYYCSRYAHQRNAKDIYFSVSSLAVAAIARPQVGVCWVVLFWIITSAKDGSRKLKDLIHLVCISAASFLAIGLSDLYIRGSFHQSLKMYWEYNRAHSADYGSYPVTYYLPVLLLLGLLPFWVTFRRTNFDFRKAYKGLGPAIGYFVVFFSIHSLVKHKEERFLYPLIPTILILLTPWLHCLVEQKKILRFKVFAGLNTILFFGIALFPAQWNTAGVIRYLALHPQYTEVAGYRDSGSLYPTIYSARVLPELDKVETLDMQFVESLKQCNKALIIREDYLGNVEPGVLSQLQTVGTFRPGPLEAMVVKLNPKKNVRRGTLHAMAFIGCPAQ